MRLGRWAALALLFLAASIAAKLGWAFLRADAPGPPSVALTVETKPLGAEIWLDGFPLGKVTPARLSIDNALPHEVELRLAGWMKARRTIPVGQAEATLPIELREAGTIQVTSDPPGASVTADDGSAGTTPCTLQVAAASPARVTATLEGYLPTTGVITPASRGVTPWLVRLRAAGRIDLSSDPPEVMALVDGQTVGKTPRSIWVEADVPHSLEIVLGKLRVSRVVTVEARATQEVALRIEDAEDQKLGASLRTIATRLTGLRVQIARLDKRHPNELRAALARTHQQELLEEEVDRLERREQEIEGNVATHRTELEERARALTTPASE